MMKNITLAVDEGLLARFRLLAAEQRTTVNALVRKHMEEATGTEERRRTSIARMLELSRQSEAWDAQHPATGERGPLRLSREDTYAERLDRWPRGS